MFKFLFSILVIFSVCVSFGVDTQIDRNIHNVLKSGSSTAVSIKAPSGLSSPWNFIFPTGPGTVGQYLQTDGSGNLSWNTPSGSFSFPLLAPSGGSPSAPNYSFAETGNDTGMYSSGDGVINWSNQGGLGMTLDSGHNLSVVGTVGGTNFIYPSKTANTFLSGPTTGSPAAPTFRAIGAGDIPNAAIPWPLLVPNTGTPNIRSDSDTGFSFPSDGLIDVYNNNVNTLALSPSSVISTVPITAPNFVFPAQTANLVFAGPATGSPGVPTFRTLTSADVPSSISFPVVVPNTSTPNIKSDSDTGIAFPSDGLINFFNNNVNTLALEPGQAVYSVPVIATNFVYPVKPANTFLAGPVTGADAIPFFRTIQQGDIPNSALTFPMILPSGSSDPDIRFDSDTGMYSTGDGNISFKNDNTVVLALNPSGATITGDLGVTGNISAANYPPTGSANTFAGYGSGGVLAPIPGWGWDATSAGVRASNVIDIGGAGHTLHNFEFGLEATSNPSAGAIAMNIDSHFDRANNGFHMADTFTGFSVGNRVEGTAQVDQVIGANISSQVGNGSAASSNLLRSILSTSSVGPTATVTDFVGNDTSLDVQGTLTEDATIIRGFSGGTIGRNLTGIQISTNSSVGGNLEIMNGFSSGAAITGNYRGINIGNNSPVAEFASGYSFNQGGEVQKAFSAFDLNLSASIGTATGFGHNLINLNVHDGNITGNMTAFNFTNSSPMVDNNNITGINLSNNATGYRWEGIGISNSGNMTEESRGFYMNDTVNARTKTGVDINMAGNATDDATGLRVNMNGTTSTNNNPRSIQTDGGNIGINSKMKFRSGAGVDIMNNITGNMETDSDVTGTDYFFTFLQNNIAYHHNVATGPFGIGQNGTTVLNQIQLDSGVTVDSFRSLMVGTTLPGGSGGTITEYVNLELLGLPSFGGSATVPTKIGLQDSTLLGQQLCDSTTNCWGVRIRDTRAENALGKLAINNSGLIVESGRTLDVTGNTKFQDSHLKSSQTTAPTTLVNGDAGTDATCDVLGTDSYGQITLNTGSGAWSAGDQCAINFNQSFTASPKCIFSAANSSSAIAVANVYSSTTTSSLTILFVNAETSSTSYVWDYHCAETN